MLRQQCPLERNGDTLSKCKSFKVALWEIIGKLDSIPVPKIEIILSDDYNLPIINWPTKKITGGTGESRINHDTGKPSRQIFLN